MLEPETMLLKHGQGQLCCFKIFQQHAGSPGTSSGGRAWNWGWTPQNLILQKYRQKVGKSKISKRERGGQVLKMQWAD